MKVQHESAGGLKMKYKVGESSRAVSEHLISKPWVKIISDAFMYILGGKAI